RSLMHALIHAFDGEGTSRTRSGISLVDRRRAARGDRAPRSLGDGGTGAAWISAPRRRDFLLEALAIPKRDGASDDRAEPAPERHVLFPRLRLLRSHQRAVAAVSGSAVCAVQDFRGEFGAGVY